MKSFTVHARRWELGWELHVDGVGVTQVRTLDRALQQVRDLIATMEDTEVSPEQVTVIVELGELGEQVRQAREKTQRAALMQADAAAESRGVVRQLREAGLSVADIAHMMGVSRGRVSQLV